VYGAENCVFPNIKLKTAAGRSFSQYLDQSSVNNEQGNFLSSFSIDHLLVFNFKLSGLRPFEHG